LRLAIPPSLVRVNAEIAPADRFSTLLSFGLGTLPVEAGGRTPVVVVELQPRVYAVGGAARGGAFVGASVLYARAAARRDAPARGARTLDAPLLATGLSAGPVVGAKFVARSGLTVEAHGGIGWVLADRPAGARRVTPLGDVSLGWTF
jgi:hypothetical protein